MAQEQNNQQGGDAEGSLGGVKKKYGVILVNPSG
jgi:hypothetical protein